MGGRVSVLALRGVKQEARREVKSSSPKHWAEDTGREKGKLAGRRNSDLSSQSSCLLRALWVPGVL